MIPAACANGEMNHPTGTRNRPSRKPAELRSYHGVLILITGSAFGANLEIGPRNTAR
jgi:hypothetical protein